MKTRPFHNSDFRLLCADVRGHLCTLLFATHTRIASLNERVISARDVEVLGRRPK